ncbi:MAG: tRNA lysidine(34) synthetase TilS [Marinobacterium sp.]|nr:tRNA lysidine(34) synthetase TilS [Marinobacterium sp.]
MHCTDGDLDSHFCQQIASLSPAPRRWLVAHSGGLDSQVLLQLAARHLPADSLQVIHVNHQLQPQASQWAQFSAACAQQLGLVHHTVTLNLTDVSENSAREGRYAAFTGLIENNDCLLMGHHGDDQAETLLFRLLRGSGLNGLAGIPVQRPLATGRLFRPLLSQPRVRLEQWACEQALEWVEDPSNQHDDYDRNYLRHRVMPLLSRRWPGFIQRWGQTTSLLSRSQQLLEHYLDQELQALQGNQQQLDCGRLPTEPLRRQALLHRWLQQRGISAGPEQLLRIERELIAARVDAQPRLQFGCYLLRRYRQQLFCLQAHIAPAKNVTRTLLPGVYSLGDGQLSVHVVDAGVGLKTLDDVCLVRRQGGEYLRPAGRGGRCSLKKLLQEAEIPPWQRADWPLLIKDGEVVAVPGVCVCEGWQAQSDGFALDWLPF